MEKYIKCYRFQADADEGKAEQSSHRNSFSQFASSVEVLLGGQKYENESVGKNIYK